MYHHKYNHLHIYIYIYTDMYISHVRKNASRESSKIRFFFETWFSQNRLSSKISFRDKHLWSANKLVRQNPLSLADLALLRCHRARVRQKVGPKKPAVLS